MAAERALSIDEVSASVSALRDLLDERDRSYIERFNAAERNVTTAMTASEKAVTTAMAAAEKAVATAMSAAEKAVAKAEMAAEKRFDCVEADTPILCADLIWRPAGELKSGDELIAFDEEPDPDSGRRGRRFRRSIVVANSVVETDDLWEVQTPRGVVRCNTHHPWLCRPQDKRVAWEWVRTDALSYGDAVHHVFNPWAVDTSWESGWLAGMFDGEGCLTLDKNRRTQLTVTQRESPTATRLEAVLKKRVEFVGAFRSEPGLCKRTCPLYHFIVTRLPDVMTLLGSVRPPRLLARADIVWDQKPLGGWHRSTLITSAKKAGSGKIAVLSTSTKTYIAAGFAMHNSVNEFRQQLADQQITFARTDAVAASLSKITETTAIQFNNLEQRSAELSKRLGELSVSVASFHATYGGRSNALSDAWGWIVGLAGIVIAALAFWFKGTAPPH